MKSERLECLFALFGAAVCAGEQVYYGRGVLYAALAGAYGLVATGIVGKYSIEIWRDAHEYLERRRTQRESEELRRRLGVVRKNLLTGKGEKSMAEYMKIVDRLIANEIGGSACDER